MIILFAASGASLLDLGRAASPFLMTAALHLFAPYFTQRGRKSSSKTFFFFLPLKTLSKCALPSSSITTDLMADSAHFEVTAQHVRTVI